MTSRVKEPENQPSIVLCLSLPAAQTYGGASMTEKKIRVLKWPKAERQL